MIVALDYETVDDRGASFEYFRADFRILSLSLTWRNDAGELESWFEMDQELIYNKLKWLADKQIPVVAHNFQFEMGVTYSLYPDLTINWLHDTMRLCKLRDGGGEEYNNFVLTQEQELDILLGEASEDDIKKENKRKKGLSLEACARRFLPAQNHDHKSKAHKYLEDKFGITKNHGGNLHRLPYYLLKQYNIADTETTLLLYEDCLRFFEAENFDLKPDTQLYNVRVCHIAEAYKRGLRISQEKLLQYILDIEAEIKAIEDDFYTRFSKEIRKVRKWLYLEKRLEMLALKTEKNRQKRWEAYMKGKFKDKLTFNFNSNSRHLPMLFLGVLKIKPKFRTKTGLPSFKSSHLSQWGEGGEMLIKRKKRLLVLSQAVSIYVASLYDGLLHPQVKAAGTRTNRVSGGR